MWIAYQRPQYDHGLCSTFVVAWRIKLHRLHCSEELRILSATFGLLGGRY